MREVRDALAVGAWAGGAEGRTGEVGSAQKAGSVGKRGGRSTQWAGSADGRRRPTQGKLPACVHHCQAQCMEYGPIADLAAKMTDARKQTLTVL